MPQNIAIYRTMIFLAIPTPIVIPTMQQSWPPLNEKLMK